MVLTLLKGLGNAFIKSKKGGVEAITGIKPFSKTGGETVKEWKRKVQHKKYLDAIRAAGDEVTGKLKTTAEKLKKLNETLKKQKKILDD